MKWKTVPVTDDVVALATHNGLTETGTIEVGFLKFKSMRLRKDTRGWFVMRGARGHDKVYLANAEITKFDGDDENVSVVFKI